MTYQNIRFIAYTLDTMPKVDSNGKESYLGVAAPAGSPHTVDIDARCALMLRAIQTAAAQLPASSPAQPAGGELNVFMAPEFFFRGPLGAYSMDEVQLVINRMQTMVAAPEWSDWLFVFGSIVGFSAPTYDMPPYAIDPGKPREAFNFTLTQQGGPEHVGAIGAKVVMKELQSSCDFIAALGVAGAQLVSNVTYVDAGASGAGREQQQLAYDGAGVFACADITWGVEICLDHYNNSDGYGRLQRSPQLPGEQQIQVQLVPSGGMRIQELQTMAMPGGYVFNCDGQNGGSATLKRVDAIGSPPTHALADIAALATYAVDGGPLALADASPPPSPISIDELYARGAGSIIVFAPVVIPAPATVPGYLLQLNWQASNAYQFNFQLVYDAQGAFVTALCQIRSTRKNFGDRSYFLPLHMQTRDVANADIRFHINIVPGPSGDSSFVRCQIDTPQFRADGFCLEFKAAYAGQDSCIVSW